MLRPSQSQSFHFLCKHVHRSIIFGQSAADQHKRLTADSCPIPVVDIGPHDHVRHSGFVFDKEEDYAFGGFRALPGNDEAGHLTFHAGFQVDQIPIERESGW